MTALPDRWRIHAEAARGFMPTEEGHALYRAALTVDVPGPMLEIGSYCGKSAVYLGAAAHGRDRLVFALDHHRGSEENQAGWEHHEPDLVDRELNRLDTLPVFRRTIHDAGLEGTVVAVVATRLKWGESGRPRWRCCLSMGATATNRPIRTTKSGFLIWPSEEP